MQADYYFDLVLDIAKQGSDDAQRDRLRGDALKSVLGRMNSRKIGNRVEQTLKGTICTPLIHQRAGPKLTPDQQARMTKLVQDKIAGDRGA